MPGNRTKGSKGECDNQGHGWGALYEGEGTAQTMGRGTNQRRGVLAPKVSRNVGKSGQLKFEFFHNSTRVRREVEKIFDLKKENGEMVEGVVDITAEAVSFFHQLLNIMEGSNL